WSLVAPSGLETARIVLRVRSLINWGREAWCRRPGHEHWEIDVGHTGVRRSCWTRGANPHLPGRSTGQAPPCPGEPGPAPAGGAAPDEQGRLGLRGRFRGTAAHGAGQSGGFPPVADRASNAPRRLGAGQLGGAVRRTTAEPNAAGADRCAGNGPPRGGPGGGGSGCPGGAPDGHVHAGFGADGADRAVARVRGGVVPAVLEPG